MAAIVAKHIQACSCNAYEINEFLRKGHSLIDCQNIELGGAVYPSISLSNHSCAANTSRTNYGRQGVVMATRTINTNEKVYDNYGHFYHTDPRETRQQVLAAQYFFPCSCLACKDDWPTYRELSRKDSDLLCYYCRYPIQDILKKVKITGDICQFMCECVKNNRTFPPALGTGDALTVYSIVNASSGIVLPVG